MSKKTKKAVETTVDTAVATFVAVLTKDELSTQLSKLFPSNIKSVDAKKALITVVDLQTVDSEKASPNFFGTKLFVFTLNGKGKRYSMSYADAYQNGAKVQEVGDEVTIDIDGMGLKTDAGSYAFELF